MIVLGLGLHCSGNSQRWRNGGVLGAGKIWKNVQMISTAWRLGGWPPSTCAVAVLLQVKFVVR